MIQYFYFFQIITSGLLLLGNILPPTSPRLFF